MSRRFEHIALNIWFAVYIGIFIAMVAYGISQTYIPLMKGTL